MTKRKPTKHEDDILRNIRQPDRYDPNARRFGGPWRMVKCKDGAYVCYEQHLEIIDNLRKNAEINDAQSPHDGIHTCSKGCSKPGCNRSLRDTIEEQDAQIEALKQDLLEQSAAARHLRFERVHDLNQIGGLQEENQSLAGQVRQFEEHRDTAAQIIKRLEAEVEALTTNPTSRLLRAEREENARLRSQFANSEWQPIETAPKDGTWVLLWWKETPTGSECFDEWSPGQAVGKWHYDCWMRCSEYSVGGAPTAWQPLPKAPHA